MIDIYNYLRRFLVQCCMKQETVQFWELESSYCLDRLIVDLERRWE